MSNYGVFDALVIGGGSVVLDRPLGPLEHGGFDVDGVTWIPEPDPQCLFVDGFGVDAITGIPYYDDDRATPGEEAALWIDPTTSDVWLETLYGSVPPLWLIDGGPALRSSVDSVDGGSAGTTMFVADADAGLAT